MSDESHQNQLENCPRCGYSLQGLPTEHHCPECGLEVDLRWRAFGARLSPKKRKQPYYLVLILAGIAWFHLMLLWSGLILRTFLPANIAMVTAYIFAITITWLLWRYLRGSKSFVAVGPKELVLYHHPDKLERHQWETVGKAYYNLVRKSVDIRINEKTMRLSARKFFGNNVWEAEACTSYIKQFANLQHKPPDKPNA